ncbi:MAG: flippase [Pusillimonas sp.]|nr:flippase [Pusillimonas sp.]MBC40769.1 flippase [Pusillimonas sp.]
MSLARNTMWNLVGTALPFLVGVVTIPYLFSTLGVEAFGVLTLIWVLIGYFGLFDFGLGRALTQQIAASLGANRCENIPDLARSGLVFTLWTGLAGGVVLLLVAEPLVESWLQVSAGLSDDMIRSLMIAAFGIPLATLTTGLRGILEAYEDFRAISLIRFLLGTANFVLPAMSAMWFGPSLTPIVIALMVARLVVCVAHLWLVHRRLPIGWWRSAPLVRQGQTRGLISFGAWMTVSNLTSPIMVTADRFAIAAVLGAGAVAYYTVPVEMMLRILILPGALTGALFPRLAATLVIDRLGAQGVYWRCLKLVAMVVGPICMLTAVGGYWGLAWWLNPEFAAESWPIVSVMSLGILLNALAFVPFACLQAAGQVRITAVLHIIECVIYVPLLFIGLYLFGVLGAAMVWTLRAGLDLGLLLIFSQRRVFYNQFSQVNGAYPVESGRAPGFGFGSLP